MCKNARIRKMDDSMRNELKKIITKGNVKTELEAKLFLSYADEINAEDVKETGYGTTCLVNIRIYLSKDRKCYCEIYGNQDFDRFTNKTYLTPYPGRICFYGPYGEASSYIMLLEHMLDYTG